MSDRVLIYVAGSDARLRSISWELLHEELVSHADRLDRASIHLQGEHKKRKVSHSGVAVLLTTTQDKLSQTMARLRVLGAGDDIRAYALPVLDLIE
jgi:ATP-dependent protease HslVU (ClpYQ) peptidase subunit